VALDGAFGQVGKGGDLGDGNLFQMIEREQGALQRGQGVDGRMQVGVDVLLAGQGFQIDAIADPIDQGGAVVAYGVLHQRDASPFQVPLGNRIGNLRDPRFQCALAAVLMQRLMDAQEGFLTQLAGVVGVADHAIDHAPAKALILPHQLLERPGLARQNGVDQFPVGIETVGRRGRRCAHVP